MRIRKQLHLPPPPSLVAPPPPPPPPSPPSLDLPTPSSLPPFLHPHGDLNLSTPSHHLLHPPPKHVKKQIPLGIKEDEPQDEESQAGAKEERFSMSNGRNSSAKACSHGILSSSSSSSPYQENEKTDDVTPKTTEKYVVVVEKTEDNEVQTSTTENKKKNKRVRINGAMLLEGSRCSRVNGRGWRCSQQTLGGYSLCEHHLGKGRLRSVTNGPKRKKESLSSYSIPEDEDEDGEESEDSLSTRTKKRKKIGMVKARSMSSLLSVAQHASNTITT